LPRAANHSLIPIWLATSLHQRAFGKMTEEALVARIRAMHVETGGAYGWPRIRRDLPKRGLRVGKQRKRRVIQVHYRSTEAAS
jgi:hypothetical protein